MRVLGQVARAANRVHLLAKQGCYLHVRRRCTAVIQGQVTVQPGEILDLIVGDDPQVDLFVFTLELGDFGQ
ncbi:hypothetical protein D3C81_1851970 [compost metagenome]